MVNPRYAFDVFISYSHKDKEWVHKVLLPTLETNGIRVCIDIRDFLPGKPSLLNMQEASHNSRHTLLVLTPNWLESEWTLYESLLARTDDPAGFQRRTIPLMLQRCDPPPFLAMLTWVDFTNPKHEKEAWRLLFRALEKTIEKPTLVKASGKRQQGTTRSESAEATNVKIEIGKDVQGSVIIVGSGNTVTLAAQGEKND
ncbi:MAG: toll/interleukin-1 receptor domain-containing protein [Anaerolineales bacterium]|nr:toll/interleukin-1 receptor domain-containing protein [Anaerolineales bacterium]MDW8226614.1 toll/interleukin-1 receptor domain-containing protein [Anaerolineales bacterium]